MRDIAGGDFAADDSAGNNLAVIRNGRDNDDLEAVFSSELPKQVHVASLLMTKAEGFADENCADVQIAGQERGRFFTAARCSCAPSRFLFDLHLKLETVVSELHVRESHLAQALVGFRVGQIVSDVGEPCTARIELPDERERLVNRLVHGMWDVTQRVDDQVVEALEQGPG